MADNRYLPGIFNLVTTVELAVRRSQALEASHVLPVPPAEGAGKRLRHRGPVVMVVALIRPGEPGLLAGNRDLAAALADDLRLRLGHPGHGSR